MLIPVARIRGKQRLAPTIPWRILNGPKSSQHVSAPFSIFSRSAYVNKGAELQSSIPWYSQPRRVCNANMDGRDVVCIMPTGASGHERAALLNPGVTLVISPLIALITDQILHLREAGIEAVKLTGGTYKQEAREIQNRLVAMASAREDWEVQVIAGRESSN
ncbi:ATP-dependent DNA helicase [Mycena kentingensis (nom. inval.)]|nr:ATP-dependent DNA helicase [Mycena kentingensis (nom. inval.)]